MNEKISIIKIKYIKFIKVNIPETIFGFIWLWVTTGYDTVLFNQNIHEF